MEECIDSRNKSGKLPLNKKIAYEALVTRAPHKKLMRYKDYDTKRFYKL